jgi:ribonuclease P protein component
MNISKLHNIKSLKKRLDISKVLENGKKIRTKYGLIFLFNDISDDRNKAAVLLKKSIGSAVKRNSVKRRIRSIIRGNVLIFFNSYNRVVFIYTYHGNDKFSLIEEEYINRMKKV